MAFAHLRRATASVPISGEVLGFLRQPNGGLAKMPPQYRIEGK